MREALYNEDAGYYTSSHRQRWGREGDYRTSPETSELFAGTLARYFAELYEQLGRPARWQIVECGAGAGDFALGVLEALHRFFPDVYRATNYLIDEISKPGVETLKQRLQPFAERVDFGPLVSLDKIKDGVIFSNELLDSFPVHRITMQDGALREFYVGLNSSGGFEWVGGPVSNHRVSDIYFANGIEIAEGQIIELSPDIDDWLKTAAERLQRGYIVTVDYGSEASELYGPERTQGSLRAFSQHDFAEVLESPGERDITAHVNWTRVRSVGDTLGLKTVKFERQDKFLLEAGILEELARRKAVATSEAEKARLSTSARAMLLPGEMASSFQVLVQERVQNREIKL